MKERTKCEVWSRVVGFLRPTQSWNKSKKEEFRNRKVFDIKSKGGNKMEKKGKFGETEFLGDFDEAQIKAELKKKVMKADKAEHQKKYLHKKLVPQKGY